MVAFEGTADEDALDRFGHVQPGAAERGVQWHDAVLEQPADDRPTQMAGQVVPDEQQTERRQRLGRLVAEPVCPARQRWPLLVGASDGWQRREHLGQFSLEPGMEDGVRRVGGAFRPHLASGRTEQGQQFGGPATDVLVRAERGLSHRCPGCPRLRNRLVRPGLILAPDWEPSRLT